MGYFKCPKLTADFEGVLTFKLNLFITISKF